MSYDLAVWEGARPESDELALAHYQRQMALADALYESRQPPAPPTAAIAELLQAVTARFPADEEDGVWSVPPSAADVGGSFAYLTMTFPGAARAGDAVVEMALARGLVVFDPQTTALATGTSTP